MREVGTEKADKLVERVIVSAFVSWYDNTDACAHTEIFKKVFMNCIYQLAREYPDEIPFTFEDGKLAVMISKDLDELLKHFEQEKVISSTYTSFKKLTEPRRDFLAEIYPSVMDYLDTVMGITVWRRRFVEIISLGQ